MEHDPDSDHVFLPFEGVVMREVSKVRDPFFTSDFLIVNPGRTTGATVAADCSPVGDVATTENEYCVPFFRPEIVHVVTVLVHPADAGTDVTT